MTRLADVATLSARLVRAFVLGKVPNYVIAFVTGRCNMACTFCCPAARAMRDTSECSPEQWGQALAGADALIHLTITGGEPFLRTDLGDVISNMLASSGAPRLSINTNGEFTDRTVSTLETLLRRFPRVDTCLTVSLDGPRDVHDALRRTPGGFQRARDTIDAVQGLRRTHPRFSLRLTSVLQPDNAPVLEAFLDETARWPIDFHELALIRDVPRAVQQRVADDYARLTALQLRRASRRYLQSVDWYIARRLRGMVLDQLGSAARPFHCVAGGRMVELMADGTVRGCEMEAMWDWSDLGSVVGRRLVDVLAAEPARRFRARASRCRCTFECALTSRFVFQPRAWPALSRPAGLEKEARR